jgi:hypothetical protein
MCGAPTTGVIIGKVVYQSNVDCRRLIASVDWFCFGPKWRSFDRVHVWLREVKSRQPLDTVNMTIA